MKRGTKITLWIGVPLFLFASVILILTLKYKLITALDYSYDLSPKEEVINVQYIAWACDCANWKEIKPFNKDYAEEIDANDCIFIEAGSSDLEIPDEFWNNSLGHSLYLKGSFYENKGLPRDYDGPGFEKPDKARVFRYTKIEMATPIE